MFPVALTSTGPHGLPWEEGNGGTWKKGLLWERKNSWSFVEKVTQDGISPPPPRLAMSRRLQEYQHLVKKLKLPLFACPLLSKPRVTFVNHCSSAPPVLSGIKEWAWEGVCVLSRSVVSNSCHPRDCSPRGSSVHGIPQETMLEWVAISFSNQCSESSSCFDRLVMS